MKLTQITDILQQPYIALEFNLWDGSYNYIDTYIKQLKSHLGEYYELCKYNKELRDGQCKYHLTVFNSMLCKKNPELLKNENKIINDLEFKGLGSISKENKRTYYIIVTSDELNKLTNKEFFYITLGFTHKDIFNKTKDLTTLIK